jgi:sporulation protein YlmC with PRC-barrel domain
VALLRGSDLMGLPVVTMSGDDIGEVRDVLFDATRGVLLGFTLNKRGRFRGRMAEVLSYTNVMAVGPDAVMVGGAFALTDAIDRGFEGSSETAPSNPIGDVLSDRVLTDSGEEIGSVTDVVIDTNEGTVVGFEIAPMEERKSRNGRKSYLPFHDTRSVSRDTLIVPAAAIEYIASDFAGFAEAVDRYRADLAQSRVGS